MTGYTEFKPINLKSVFTKVDLAEKEITTNIIYDKKVIITLMFNLSENSIKKEGSFIEIDHFKEFGIDEQYIISRIKEKITSIVENNISEPKDFLYMTPE